MIVIVIFLVIDSHTDRDHSNKSKPDLYASASHAHLIPINV